MSAHLGKTTPDSSSFKDEVKLEDGTHISHILTSGQDELNPSAPTRAEERELHRIMRKMDWRVLPIASILYLFSFLDRSAIGNAKVAGMNTELKLTAKEYNISVSVFFFLYCLLEIPSNLAAKKWGVRNWLPIIVVVWGLAMLFTGLVKNFAGLVSLRLILGGAEAGLFPGISYWLSTLYPRRNIQTRIALFFSAATVAGAFGGLLAYGLARVKTGNYEGWSWIFIVEGLLTVAVGIASYWILFSGFSDAKFLTNEEAQFMKYRIDHDSTAVPMDDSYRWQYVVAALTDWKPWASVVAYICCLAPLYSIALTLPVILRSLGYTAVRSQLMTVPVYCVAAVMVIVFAYFSDKFHNRSVPFMLGCFISMIGWIMGYVSKDSRVRYAAMFLGAFSYPAFPSIVALLSQNVGGKTKRSVSIAIQVGVGGLSGIISANIFFAQEAPYYHSAHKINIGMNAAAIVSAGVYWFLLARANAEKRRKVESGEAARISHEELSQMGDASPYFLYKY